MGLLQPNVMLAYAVPASEATSDGNAALLARPILQWLATVLHDDGGRGPSRRAGQTIPLHTGHSHGRENSAAIRSELRDSLRTNTSALSGLYLMAQAREQELEKQRDSSGSSGTAPLSDAEGLAAMRAFVTFLHEQDPATQQQHQQTGSQDVAESSLLQSLYRFVALEAGASPGADGSASPMGSLQQQQSHGLQHSPSLHRALCAIHDAAVNANSPSSSLSISSNGNSSSSSAPHKDHPRGEPDEMEVLSLLAKLLIPAERAASNGRS